MNDEPTSSKGGPSFAEPVGAKAVRRLEARRNPSHVWFGLGMMGLIGWSVVIPTLLGAGLGHWLDARYADGPALLSGDQNERPARSSIGAVVFGSDQGLAGQFNEVVADLAMETLAALPGKSQAYDRAASTRSCST